MSGRHALSPQGLGRSRNQDRGRAVVWLQYGAPLARRLSSWGEHLVFHPKTSSSRLPWGRQPGLRARWTPSGLLLALSGPRLWHGFGGGC